MMNKTILLLFFVFYFEQFLFADDKDWCEPPVDLSSDFPSEVKDQEDLGYCFAFAATSLVENYACRTEKFCKPLSTMDAISQYPESIRTVGDISDMQNESYSEEGFMDINLDKIRSKGLCSSELAPYNGLYANFSAKESWDTLIDGYNESTNGSCNDAFSAFDDLSNQLRYASTIDAGRLESAISMPNQREYLRYLLIGDECKKNRKHFDYDVNGYFIAINSNLSGVEKVEKHIDAISVNLIERKPLIIEFKCNPNSPICQDPNYSHAVIIKGMRRNQSTGKCELLILNSWGKEWQDNNDGGYIEADAILPDIYDVRWLE